MGDGSTKLIVLRGPSASGKSTVAKEILKSTERNVAFIQEDYIRRELLQRHDDARDVHKLIIHDLVTTAFENHFDVVLEGILSPKYYGDFLRALFDQHKGENYLFHLNVSFEETLKRHQTKPVKSEYGASEMQQWFPAGAPLNIEMEEIIPESSSQEQTIKHIQKVTGL